MYSDDVHACMIINKRIKLPILSYHNIELQQRSRSRPRFVARRASKRGRFFARKGAPKMLDDIGR